MTILLETSTEEEELQSLSPAETGGVEIQPRARSGRDRSQRDLAESGGGARSSRDGRGEINSKPEGKQHPAKSEIQLRAVGADSSRNQGKARSSQDWEFEVHSRSEERDPDETECVGDSRGLWLRLEGRGHRLQSRPSGGGVTGGQGGGGRRKACTRSCW